MLSGNVRQQPCAIAGLQMKRSYRGAFLDDLRHRQDAPPGGKRGGTQPVGGLRPVTGHQRIRGPAVLPEGPAQGQSVAAANNAASLERPQPFRPLESRNLWRIQNDLGVTGHLQHVATRVVDEDKPGLAVQYDIAERCKEEVSIEVRNGKRAIVRNTNEAGLATAMGHVDLASIFAVGIRRDKKCVCRRDHGRVHRHRGLAGPPRYRQRLPLDHERIRNHATGCSAGSFRSSGRHRPESPLEWWRLSRSSDCGASYASPCRAGRSAVRPTCLRLPGRWRHPFRPRY